MHKYKTLALVVSSVLATAALSAASTQPAASPSPTTPATAGKMLASTPAAPTMKAQGAVASVDAAARTFSIHPKTGSDLTFSVTDTTAYVRSKKAAALSDLKAGDWV